MVFKFSFFKVPFFPPFWLALVIGEWCLFAFLVVFFFFFFFFLAKKTKQKHTHKKTRWLLFVRRFRFSRKMREPLRNRFFYSWKSSLLQPSPA